MDPRIDARWVEVDGVRARVLEAGEGPVLLRVYVGKQPRLAHHRGP